METTKKRWFSAVDANDLATMEKMLIEGFDANTADAAGETALKKIAAKLYEAIMEMAWELEVRLKEIAATLIIYGGKQEDLGHTGGVACDISHAITLHIIKTAAVKGDRRPVDKLIADEQLWFYKASPAIKAQLFNAIKNRDVLSVEKMYEYQMIGFRPSQ